MASKTVIRPIHADTKLISHDSAFSLASTLTNIRLHSAGPFLDEFSACFESVVSISRLRT